MMIRRLFLGLVIFFNFSLLDASSLLYRPTLNRGISAKNVNLFEGNSTVENRSPEKKSNPENKNEVQSKKSSSTYLLRRQISDQALKTKASENKSEMKQQSSQKNMPKQEQNEVLQKKKIAAEKKKDKSLDLNDLDRENKAIVPRSYKVVDPVKIDLFLPTQRLENGVQIRYNERMQEPIHNYVEALQKAPQYQNLVKAIPEIFTTYVIEFITSQPFLISSYKPQEVVPKSFTWKEPLSDAADISNLYQGMQFLNKVDFSNNYSTKNSSDNPFMFADMDVYVEALRSEYMHVPDVILETYVTAYLKDPQNQKYVQRQTSEKMFGFFSTTKSVNDVTQPIMIRPEDLVYSTKGQFITKKDFVGIEKPTVDGKLDVQNLKDYQKLYLTMEAIENINKKHPEQYLQEMSRNGLQIKEQQVFEQKKADAISSSGSYEDFLFRFGIKRVDLDKPNILEVQNPKAMLQDNYPSYKTFIANKQDKIAFEQLQLDFININQDILVAKEQFEKIQNSKLKNLISTAELFKDDMNKAIIEQKVNDFVQSSFPSAEKNISLEYAEKQLDLLRDANTKQNLSEIELILNQQDKEVVRKIEFVLEQIKLQIPTTLNQASEKQLADFIREKELMRSDSIVDIGVIEQLKMSLQNLRTGRQVIEQQADAIAANSLPSDLTIEAYNKNSDAYNQVIKNNLEQLAMAIEKHKLASSVEYREIKKTVDQLVDKYEDLNLENQDIGEITKRLNELIVKYPENKDLQLYNQVIIKLHEKLQPMQLEVQKKIVLDAQINAYVDTLLAAENSSIASQIKIIQGKIDALNNKSSKVNLATEKVILNNGLSGIRLDNDFGLNVETFDSIRTKTDLKDVYTQILTKLQERQQLELENSAMYQLRNNLWNGLQNVWNRDFGQAGSGVVHAVSYTPAALVETNAILTEYVHSVLGKPLLATLSAGAAAGIAACIQQYAPLLLQIGQSNLSDEEKNRLKQEALKSMMTDIGNIVVVDQTGASADVVAGGNAQAIAVSSIFNKAISALVPEDPTAGYSYNSSFTSPGYISNLDKFQQQYNSVLMN